MEAIKLSILNYVPPTFLQNESVDEIHQRMMNNLPEDIDSTEGQFAWDFTRPTAIEKAELVEYQLNEAIKLIFPQWAYDKWLDYHATMRGLLRRDANKSWGILIVEGNEGTVIPKGFKFATVATPEVPSIIFETIDTYTIDIAKLALVEINAVEAGFNGNVQKDTITLMVDPIQGIISITNPDATTGGAEKESDEALRVRILEADAALGISYVGNDLDYIRWGKEVSGVGQVVIIQEWQGPGTVKVVCIDSNGLPANPQILNNVYEYIVSPNDRIKRRAPIGATVTVEAPSPISLTISCDVLLNSGEKKEVVMSRFTEKLQEYYQKTAKDKEIKYVYIAATLAMTAGVIDFNNLLINNATFNIPITEEQYPVTKEVIFNV